MVSALEKAALKWRRGLRTEVQARKSRHDQHIATIDAEGVALAAIQGLNQKVEEKEARIRQLEKAVRELSQLVDELISNKKGEER